MKGINFISLLYHIKEVELPVNYHPVHNTEIRIDKKTGKEKRRHLVVHAEMGDSSCDD